MSVLMRYGGNECSTLRLELMYTGNRKQRPVMLQAKFELPLVMKDLDSSG